MGIFGKLMFWKRNDEVGLDTLGLGQNTALPPVNMHGLDNIPQPWSAPGQQSFAQQPSFPPQQPSFPSQQQSFSQQPYYPQMDAFQSQGAYSSGKQMELLSVKLDALKASIDSLNQRMANIERMMQGDDYFRRKGW